MSRPTMETVAERAGVSRALVSLVMNNSSKVSEAKRQAVLHAAEQLGYRPNLHARNLAQARTKTLGMIINDIHNPFFAEVVYGVEAAADDYGFDVLILNGGRDAERERRAVETHLQFQVEALILVGPKLDDDDIIRVGGGTDRGGGVRARQSRGRHDHHRRRARRALAVQHLVELGHTDIVHIDGAANISSAPGRAAMRRPCARSGSSRESCEAATTKPTPRPQSSTSPRPIRCPPPFSPSTTSSPPAPQHPRSGRAAGSRRRVRRRVRQHVHRRAQPHVAHDGQPAATPDGSTGDPDGPGAHRGRPHRAHPYRPRTDPVGAAVDGATPKGLT